MSDSSHYQAGRHHYDDLQYDKALMHFRLSLEEEGPKPAVYSMMAHCHHALDHFTQALECCKLAKQQKEKLKYMSLGDMERKVERARDKAWKEWRKSFSESLSQKSKNDIIGESNAIEDVRKQVEQSENDIIGESNAIEDVRKQVKQAAPFDATVLITGETGVGKELVARKLHTSSLRTGKPFVSVNCGAFVETLLESELFGHVKGAFTGANIEKKGQMTVADGGSFFLDEVGEMSQQMQVKLLRVIQTRQLIPVGGTDAQKIDVRLIAATNRDLEEMMIKGEFREDLYYRLNVIPVFIPPLRERKNDIPMLVGHFFAQYIASEQISSDMTITDEALESLVNHTWPGNIRELENVIHRAVLLASIESRNKLNGDDIIGVITPHAGSHKQRDPDLIKMLPDVLKHTGWNLHDASSFLGVDLQTLKHMIRKHPLIP